MVLSWIFEYPGVPAWWLRECRAVRERRWAARTILTQPLSNTQHRLTLNSSPRPPVAIAAGGLVVLAFSSPDQRRFVCGYATAALATTAGWLRQVLGAVLRRVRAALSAGLSVAATDDTLLQLKW